MKSYQSLSKKENQKTLKPLVKRRMKSYQSLSKKEIP
jgi:hypothetical protein